MSVLRHFRGGPWGGLCAVYAIDQTILDVERALPPKRPGDPNEVVHFQCGVYHLRPASSEFIWQGWQK